MADPARSQAVAIVGMAGRFPGARGLDAFWRNVREGVEVIETFTDADLDAARVDPELRANPAYVRKGAALEDADLFDAAFFGFSPREAQTLDPQQRLFLECAWEAMEHAGYAGAAAGQSVGVYAGAGMNSYLVNQLLANPPFVASVGGYQLMVGNDKDFLATRVSYKLDLRGPSLTVQTACSTSLVAVVLACRALQRGECDMALAGGVSIPFPQRAGYLHEEGMILSPDGHCRPFDAGARGTRGGAGAGVVVLKRLADAEADRDTVHAVIRGAAVNNDGAGKAGYTAPSIEGQVEVIATSQALAGVDPRSIGYVETHGTGTPLGDPIEIAALTQVFRASTRDTGFCRIGSLKASVGHLDAAAGVASLLKTVLALEHRELPPLVNFRTPNPQLALETSPFVASASAAPWIAAGGAPRRAGVSSFGIGGTNAHLVVEEAAEAPAAARTSARGAHLLLLSAKTAPALERATADLAAHLRAHPELPLGDVEWTLQTGRAAFAHRRAAVVRDGAHAVEALGEPGRHPVLTDACRSGPRPVAFLFSGQGSQHAGMGAGLYRSERAYRDAFDRCAALFEPHLGLDLRPVVLGEAGGAIDETRLTQPALFAAEYALASLWASWGVVPAAMLGHSIGEYVAAHLAGVLSLEDAVAVVAARGRLMQALPAGSMAAVHLAAAELTRLLGAAPDVELAAANAPGLCTVSGPGEAVARFLASIEARGIEARPLHTSHAFHSAMMAPALAPFTALLERIALAPPRIPYASNLTGTWITNEQATSPAYYAKHLRHAVRFEDGVRTLAENPALLLLEVGPGTALTSLARLGLGKEGAGRAVASLPHPRERRPDGEAVLEAAGRLWLAGVAVDWRKVHAGEERRRVPLPTYPFERTRHFVEALAPPGARSDAAAARPSTDVADWLHAPTWSRGDPPAGPPRLEGTWLVLARPGPLAEAVAGRVRDAGGVPVTIEAAEALERVDASRFRVRPGSAEDLAGVLGLLDAAAPAVAGAIDLWALQDAGAANGAGDPASAPPADRPVHALVALASALQPSCAARPVLVVTATRGAASVLDERIRALDPALVIGPVLSLPAEIPGLGMRAVDLDPADGADAVDAAARQLVEEAATADGEPVSARRAGRRWVRRCEPIAPSPAAAGPLPLEPRGVYLVTGGLGGIGLALARWLATRASARLLLTSRTPLPPREAWDAWLAGHGPGDRIADAIRGVRDVERSGGEVLVAAADAADEAAMRDALDRARERWGRIDGVIHAAGVPGDNRIAVLAGPDDLRAVLAPKRDGLLVLVRLLGDTPLHFVALLSSVSATLGAPGVCGYAAANAVLDAFPESALRPACWRRVVTVGYGPWRDVGMAARVFAAQARRRDELLRWAIPSEGGVEAFGRALGSGRPRVIVAPFDLPRLLRAARDPAAAGATPAAAEAPGPPVAGRTAAPSAREAPATDTERRIAGIWTELLGVERMGVHDDFFELGGHSLLATRVLARIDQTLGARLTLRDVFEARTIRKLSELVDGGARSGTSPPPAPPEGDREEIEF